MLYVSRQIARGKFEIVDTEDGVGEIYDYQTLENILNNQDLKIEGVTYDRHKNGKVKSMQIRVSTANASVKEVKLNVLKGIKIAVNNGRLDKIQFESDGTSIILSNYCESIGDYVYGYGYSRQQGKTIVFLDDKIKQVGSKAFKDWNFDRANIDITDYNNPKVIDRLYKECFSGSYYVANRINACVQDIRNCPIIDNNMNRQLYYLAFACFNNKLFENIKVDAKKISLVRDYGHQLYSDYRREFLTVCKANFMLNSNWYKGVYVIRNTIPHLSCALQDLNIRNVTNTNILFPIVQLLIRCTTINSSSLIRLYNMTVCFAIDEEMEDSLYSFIKRFEIWFRENKQTLQEGLR